VGAGAESDRPLGVWCTARGDDPDRRRRWSPASSRAGAARYRSADAALPSGGVERREDEVSPNVVIGLGVLLCVIAVAVLIAGSPWAALAVAVLGVAFGGGAWLGVHFWPRRSEGVRRRAQQAALVAQMLMLGGLGLWDLVGGGRNQGGGVTLLALAATSALIGVTLQRRNRRRPDARNA